MLIYSLSAQIRCWLRERKSWSPPSNCGDCTGTLLSSDCLTSNIIYLSIMRCLSASISNFVAQCVGRWKYSWLLYIHGCGQDSINITGWYQYDPNHILWRLPSPAWALRAQPSERWELRPQTCYATGSIAALTRLAASCLYALLGL